MKKIFILGSINSDIVINAPYMPKVGETIKGGDFFINSGGKGANQAVAVAKAGAKVYMSGCIGDDLLGVNLKSTLKQSGVNCKYIKKLSNTDSGSAVIIISNGDNRIIINSGANERVDNALADTLLKNAQAGDIFLCQLEIPLNVVLYSLQLAKEKGLTTILNPAPALHDCEKLFEFVDILIPNENELQTLGKSQDFDTAVKYLQNHKISQLIVTLGDKGSVLIQKDKRDVIKSFKVDAIDTTAAGDTFCGYFAAGLASELNSLEAIKTASAAAALAVTRKGAQKSIPRFDEVKKFISQYN